MISTILFVFQNEILTSLIKLQVFTSLIKPHQVFTSLIKLHQGFTSLIKLHQVFSFLIKPHEVFTSLIRVHEVFTFLIKHQVFNYIFIKLLLSKNIKAKNTFKTIMAYSGAKINPF